VTVVRASSAPRLSLSSVGKESEWDFIQWGNVSQVCICRLGDVHSVVCACVVVSSQLQTYTVSQSLTDINSLNV
jgi:hypothetical protein